MPLYPVKTIIDEQPCFEVPLGVILSDLKQGGALKTLTRVEVISDRQRRWWKGVLLPALANDSGDSVMYWENYLKITVMPDDFTPTETKVGDAVFNHIPSVRGLSKKKMTYLIENSVIHLRDDLSLMWVTFPDSELRK